MSKPKGTIVVNTNRCKGCSLCIEACPQHILALVDKKVNASGYQYAGLVNSDACIGCASCAIVCPDACITVYRQKN